MVQNADFLQEQRLMSFAPPFSRLSRLPGSKKKHSKGGLGQIHDLDSFSRLPGQPA
jgi:hypothetical protein